MVNTYILSDESGECILIDAACFEKKEQEEVRTYLAGNNLKLTDHHAGGIDTVCITIHTGSRSKVTHAAIAV